MSTGTVKILDETCKTPIALMGAMAGHCYGSDTTDSFKNYKRGLNCIKSGHGRVLEFADVYMFIDGYSARVIRELYTHIAGAPTRVQESTRYIDYTDGFSYVTPPSISKRPDIKSTYDEVMTVIEHGAELLKNNGIPQEDIAMLLPLGMKTGISVRYNARTLSTMAEQRLCSRAYWEFRRLMKDIIEALCEYSPQWETLCRLIMNCKCDKNGYCIEANSCGCKPKKNIDSF